MIYHSQELDCIAIIAYIDSFAKQIDKKAKIDCNQNRIKLICDDLWFKFPCDDGNHLNACKKASIFKKAAFFAATFMHYKPLEKDGFANISIADKYKNYDANAVIAVSLALDMMTEAKMTRSDDKVFFLDKAIILSDHSLTDIFDLISKEQNIGSIFMWLSVLLEQIAYKTHPEVQYKTHEYTPQKRKPIYTSDYSKATDEEMQEWDDPIEYFFKG